MSALRWILILGLLFSGVSKAGAECYTAVTSGESWSCAMRASDSSLLCWGEDSLNQVTDKPSGTFLSFSTGNYAGCAVRTSGALVCWGDDSVGIVSETPAGTDWVTVNVGSNAACALKADGTIACWGDASYGGTAPVGNFAQVSCGQDVDCCGIKTDGSLMCWGDNVSGLATEPAGTNWVQVDTGSGTACARNSSNAITCWGSDGDNVITGTPATAASDVSLAYEPACYIAASGDTITCWGNSGSAPSLLTEPGGTFEDIDMGAFHGCALDADGNITCWGDNSASVVSGAPSHDCSPTTTTTTTTTTTMGPPPPASASVIVFIPG